MTGGRSSRGGHRDPWRGSRPRVQDDPVHPERPGGAAAELEELAVQRLAAPRRRSLGLGPVVGGLAVGVLILGGLGLLGGARPGPTPSATSAVVASHAAPTLALSPATVPARPRMLMYRQGASEIPVVEGCDVTLTLGDGRVFGRTCVEDVPTEPAIGVLRGGDYVEFALSTWRITTTTVACGWLGARFFHVDEAGACGDLSATLESFEAPPPGNWTVAIAACAVQERSQPPDRICGTWYVGLDTR